MKTSQLFYVSPNAPYALMAFGAFLSLFIVGRGAALWNLLVSAARGSSDVSFLTVLMGLGDLLIAVFVSASMIGLGWILQRYLRVPAARQTLYPNQPWMWRQDWSDKVVRINHLGPTIAICVVVTLAMWYFVKLGVSYFDSNPQSQGLGIPLAVTIGTFIGVRLYTVNRRWRHSELRLGTLPGVIGGPFQAAAVLSQRFTDGTPFRITLTCELSKGTVSDVNDSGMQTSTLWQADVVVDKQLGGGSPGTSVLPIYFSIPIQCKSSDFKTVREGDQLKKITWWLTVSLKSDPHLRSICFEVPVFKTEESSRNYKEDLSVLADYEEVVTPASVLERIPHHCETQPRGGKRYRFSLFRWQYVILLSAMCIIGLIGTTAAVWFLRPWGFQMVAALLPFGILTMGTMGLFEVLLWHSEISINDNEICVAAGYHFRDKSLKLAPSQFSAVESEVEFRDTLSDRRRLVLRTNSGVSITILKRLHGRQEADAVAQWLAEQIGITGRI